VRSFLRGLIWIGGICGALCGLLYVLFFDTWVIPGDDPMFNASILPTLFPEDRLLVLRGVSPGGYGRLARCRSPESPSAFVVGRVFGRAGDTVEVRNEHVWVAGRPIGNRHACPSYDVTHPVSGAALTLACSVEDNGAWTYSTLHASQGLEPSGGASVVEPNRLFLVSDDRHLHADSRDFGTVEESTCEHIVFRLWGARYLDGARRMTPLY
jgi:signal peptidase I